MEDKVQDQSQTEREIHLYHFAPQLSSTVYILHYFQAYFNDSSLYITPLQLPNYLFYFKDVRDEVQPPFSSSHYSEDIQVTYNQLILQVLKQILTILGLLLWILASGTKFRHVYPQYLKKKKVFLFISVYSVGPNL